MNLRLMALWCIAAGTTWGNAADAQSLSASQILQQFNAVIFQNFSSRRPKIIRTYERRWKSCRLPTRR